MDPRVIAEDPLTQGVGVSDGLTMNVPGESLGPNPHRLAVYIATTSLYRKRDCVAMLTATPCSNATLRVVVVEYTTWV